MMKKTLLLAIIISMFANQSQSQELISIKKSNRFYPCCIRTHNDTIYLGGSLAVTPDMSSTLFRYTIEGERIDSIYFDRPESTIIQSIMFRGDSTYIIATKKNTGTGLYDLELIILNHHLLVLKDTILAQNFGNAGWRCFTQAENTNEYLIYGSYWLNFPATGMEAFVLKIDYRGEILKEKRYYSNLSFFIYSLLKRNDNLYYATAGTPEFFDSTNNISTIAMVLDSDFEIKKIKTTPHFLLEFQNAFSVGNSFFGAGKSHIATSTKITYGFLKTDTNFRKKDSIYLGQLINIDYYAGAFESNVFVGVDKIYVAGTKNFYVGTGNPYAASQIQVSRLDTSLNVIWNKDFSKDSTYYQLWSMASTSDGGCLLACETYNYLSPVEKRGIVVFKVDTNGNAYAIIGDVPHETMFAIYPNPATDNIIIEIGLIPKESTVSIYDIEGHLVLQQLLNQSKQRIDVSGLSNGTYLLNIKSEKECFTKKFIKE